jgi:hypothetical protein
VKPTDEQLAKITDPNHPIFQVIQRLDAIEEKMLKQDPEIGTHLKAVHTLLREYEELAHLLSPEQIGVLVKGLQKHTTISLVVEGQAKKSRTKAEKVDINDLI